MADEVTVIGRLPPRNPGDVYGFDNPNTDSAADRASEGFVMPPGMVIVSEPVRLPPLPPVAVVNPVLSLTGFALGGLAGIIGGFALYDYLHPQPVPEFPLNPAAPPVLVPGYRNPVSEALPNFEPEPEPNLEPPPAVRPIVEPGEPANDPIFEPPMIPVPPLVPIRPPSEPANDPIFTPPPRIAPPPELPNVIPDAPPLPAPGFEPYPTPLYDPDPFAPLAPPFSLPNAPPRYAPVTPPRPGNNPEPFAPPLANPFPLPNAPPVPNAPPRPSAPPRSVPRSDPFASPLNEPLTPIEPWGVGLLDPLPGLGPIPLEDLDPCNCGRKKDNKEKKKRKPRAKCYQGTYTERALSLSKSPKKEVPCR